MPKIKNEYLVDTDILIDHLMLENRNDESFLEMLMQNGICFSTVLNASELLFQADSEIEKNIIIDLLSALKILGLHARYSLKVSLYKDYVEKINDAIMCVVADYNKLPIVTFDKYKYSKTNLVVFHPSDLKLKQQ